MEIFIRSRREKNGNFFELTSGAPCAKCATSNRKKIIFELFFEKNVQNMIRNMTESLKFSFKFHHTYEDEQSPRHEQGLIGLIG